MHRPKFAAAAALLLALAPSLTASDPALEITVVAQDGDLVPGIGTITGIQGMHVNDLGQTLVEVVTDHADPNADTVLLKDGVPYQREGDALALPAGTSVSWFHTFDLTGAGDPAGHPGVDRGDQPGGHDPGGVDAGRGASEVEGRDLQVGALGQGDLVHRPGLLHGQGG